MNLSAVLESVSLSLLQRQLDCPHDRRRGDGDDGLAFSAQADAASDRLVRFPKETLSNSRSAYDDVSGKGLAWTSVSREHVSSPASLGGQGLRGSPGDQEWERDDENM